MKKNVFITNLKLLVNLVLKTNANFGASIIPFLKSEKLPVNFLLFLKKI